MRWTWLRAAILGALLGPAPVLAEPAEGQPAAEAEAEAARQGGSHGRAVRGARFLVWEEDSREAAEWAEELAGAARRADE